MKNIPLGHNSFAIIDDDDYEFISVLKWHIHYNGRKHRPYARSGDGILMHRLILNAPIGIEIDHIDGNGLNNQKSNIRKATRRENQGNSKKRYSSSSFKGVSRDKEHGNWKTYICFNQTMIHLGRFRSEELAAQIYNCAARIIFGEFARLNIIIEGLDKQDP